MKATDKQIAFLAKKGIDASEWTKEQAHQTIEAVINKQSNSQAKVVKQPETEQIVDKKPYKKTDNSSYYVAYAKDLVVSGMPVDDAIAAISKIKAAFDKSLA